MQAATNEDNPLRDPSNPTLGGNTLDVINQATLALLIVVPVVTLLSAAADRVLLVRSRNLLGSQPQEAGPSYRKYRDEGHPALWVIVLLTISYALLIPGLVCSLFSFNIVANIIIAKIGLGPDGGMGKTDPTTESMFGLIGLLHETGSDLGALLVLTYAVLIPITKIMLLLAGECLRGRKVKTSRRCVQVVQNISKWACPDMFAYVLLMYLIRGLNHPEIVRAAGQLDLGFTCFSIFCVGSTIAAVGVKAVDKEKGCWAYLASALGIHGVFACVLTLAVAFTALMILGLQHPIMALRVKLDSLYSDHGGPIDVTLYKPIVDSLKLPDLLHADVSVITSMKGLVDWMHYGDVNSFIGLILLAVFAVGFTILDFVGLLFCSVSLLMGCGRTYSPLRICWVLKKLSMLDVTIMGVIVVTLCMVMYRDRGVVVYADRGLLQLAGAELIHYFCYYLVKGAMQHFDPIPNFAGKEDDSGSSSGSSSSESSTSDEDGPF